MRRLGLTLIELLVSLLVLSLLMGAILPAFVSMGKAQLLSTRLPAVQEDARQMAITVAAALRRAVLCTASDSGCTVDAPIESNSASAVTIYSRPSGTLVETTYDVNSGNFRKTVGGNTTILYTGASLTLSYYQSSTYRTNSLTTYTPTSTTTKNLIAVQITSSITRNGITGTYTTLVRLRNSPKKLSATE